MSTSRVGKLQLRLRIPAELAGSADQLRATAERQFVIRVLEALERLLHERFGPHTVIRIRRLAVGWQLDASELAASDVAVRLAHELADQISADIAGASTAERLRPRGERFAVFDGDDHADAVYLADAAEAVEGHWLHAGRTSAAVTWDELLARGPSAIASVVAWLRRMDRLDVVIGAASERVQAAIAAVVPHVAGVVELVRARSAAARWRLPADGGSGASSTEPNPPAAEASGSHESVTIVAHAPGEPEPPAIEPAAGVAEPAASLEPSAHRNTPARPPQTRTGAPAPASAHEAIVEANEPDGTLAIDTHAAGLFYLAGRVLEIELAERLWAAGLPEGAVLVAIGDAILGTAAEPAARWFGGAFDSQPTIPPIETWAMTEVNEVVQHVLGRRLVDFGVRLSPAELDASLEHLARDVPTSLANRVAHQVVARSVAALATIVCARLGRAPSLDAVRNVCRRPGRLVLLSGELRVVMSHQTVDIDHRRAGLDHDPGHVPWLGRCLRFEFAGGEEI